MDALPIRPDYEAALSDAGLRLTRQRQIILQVLAGNDAPHDAAAILRHARALDRRISLATVYRTLRALEAAGVLDVRG